MKLEGLIASVVHEVEADSARLEGLVSSVVHTIPAEGALLAGLIGSVVHGIPTQDARLEGLFSMVVHDDVAPPSGGGGQGLQGGTLLQGIRLESWGLQGDPLQGD